MNTLPSHSLRCIMHSGVEPPLQRRRAAVCQRPRALANTGCRWPGVQHNCSSIPQQVVRVATAALLAGALAWSPCSPAGAETLTGPARAVDGDTLVVGGVRVRLYGVDAPESAQTCNDAGGKAYPCGAVAAEALKARVTEGPVRCEVRNRDQYGRAVASCSLAGGIDAGEYMVGKGLAVAYRQYSKDYIVMEDRAHAARQGIWAGSFEVPADYRKRTKAQEVTGPALTAASRMSSGASTVNSGPGYQPLQPGCGIKGNVSAKGERIYHVPGGTYYDSTRIDVADGERWFCSETEAQAAGWRKAVR